MAHRTFFSPVRRDVSSNLVDQLLRDLRFQTLRAHHLGGLIRKVQVIPTQPDGLTCLGKRAWNAWEHWKVCYSRPAALGDRFSNKFITGYNRISGSTTFVDHDIPVHDM